jgi:competence protein ComEA
MRKRMREVWILAALAAVGSAQESPELFQRVCGTCHKAERAVSTRRTRQQWEEMIDVMVAKGMKASDEDLTKVLDYLVGQYGRVNVNRAQAGEIVEVLRLTAKEAEAIVKYRKDTASFEEFDDLGKVPGVDLKKLETRREAISF